MNLKFYSITWVLTITKPINNKQDITIYNYNFPRILNYLKKTENKFGSIAGLWFKEKEFVEACKKVNIYLFPKIRESAKINKEIFKNLKATKSTFVCQDIRNF